MCGGSPSAPTPPPQLPEAPRSPDPAVRDGSTARRRANGSGRSTILTSPRGVQDNSSTAEKTLLGQ